MTNRGRQIGVLMAALIGAALLLLGLPTLEAQAVPEGQKASFEKPRLSAQKAKELRENEAEIKARKKNSEFRERRQDKDPKGKRVVAGELIVVYYPGTSAETKERIRRKAGARTVLDLSEINAESVAFPRIKEKRSQQSRQQDLASKKRELEQNPSVEAVDYNYIAHTMAVNDPLLSQQWGPTLMRAPEAWDTSTGASTKIAVLDTGMDNTHPDLGGIVDEWDYVNWDSNANEDQGHATHVAGTAAARTNNATGIAGVAPAASFFDYKVCSNVNGCPFDAINSAIIDAADFGADVINLSLGGPGYTTSQEAAVNYAWSKGTVIVASSGNDAQRGNPIAYPAAFPPAIAVAAVDKTANKSRYSTYGTFVDVAAPGGMSSALGSSDPANDILSTVPTSICTSCYWYRNFTAPSNYEAWAGTSMAAPHVTGLASLLAAQGLSATEIRRRIEGTVTDLGAPGRDTYYGKGLINAHAAVTNDTAPAITALTPAPFSSTTNRTPTIGATVTDTQTNLTQTNVSLYVDGTQVASTAFTYDSGTDRLSYTATLDEGSHQVRVVAVDPQGMKTTANWQFSVL